MAEPELPDSVTAAALDTDVRRDLRGLQKETAESVARHLVAAGLLVDEDPARALEHARYARRRAARIAVVRETSGIVAYHAGEWNEALGEFRAARRMGGGSGHVPVMADIERALGRPERALELARGPEARSLEPAARIELLIVAAGARRDLGELDAAVVGLQVAELDPARRDPWSARLFYAYADNLLAVDRRSEAVQWFVHAYDADTGDETDAADRIADLTGDAPPGADTGDDDFLVALDVEDPDAAQPGAEVRPAPASDPPDTATGAPVEDREQPGSPPAGPADQPVDDEQVDDDEPVDESSDGEPARSATVDDARSDGDRDGTAQAGGTDGAAAAADGPTDRNDTQADTRDEPPSQTAGDAPDGVDPAGPR